MVMSSVIFGLLFFLIIGSYVKQYMKRRKYPPGPLGIPFVGERPIRILRFLFPKIFHSIPEKQYYLEMKKKYGNIWSVDVGDKTIVVLASIDALTEALIDQGKLYSGRPFIESLKIISESRGIMFSDGDIWFANRQLAIKALRDLGMGKKILDNQICEEADELVENIEKDCSKLLSNPEIFDKTSSNTITKLIFGERNKYDDPDFEWYMKNLKGLAHSGEAHYIMETFSSILSLRTMRKLFRVVDEYQKNMDECMKFIANKCRARIKVEGEYSKPACVFDFYWRYRYQDYPDTDFEERILDISHSIFDMLFGATDTINNILGFGCLVLGKDRDLQCDLRKEIQAQADDYKLINMDMRKSCPKILSFIDEINRFFPLDTFLHRRAITNTVLRGYNIKYYDVVYGDLNTIARDPVHFENPDVFNAYRFLDKTGTKYIPSKSVISFGVGKRACPGESMALVELFLFLSKVLLRFDISLPSETRNKYDEILEGTVGLVYAPLDHKISFKVIE